MKLAKVNSSDERRVLTAMIVNDEALKSIASQWRDDGLFIAPWANLVGRWCVSYVQKYGKAPKRRIQDLFDDWSNNGADKDTVQVINKFLVSLSDQYRRKNEDAQYAIDLAARCFNRSTMLKLADDVQANLEIGNDRKAEEILSEYRPVEFARHLGVDLFRDHQVIRDTLDAKRNEELLQYPSAIGKFFRSQFTRDSFIAFMGPDKRGKSFWLLDAAFRAVLQRRRTAYFVIGDMSDKQVTRRFLARVCKRPYYPGRIEVPTAIKAKKEWGRACKIRHKVVTFSDAIDEALAFEKLDRIVQTKIRSDQSYFSLSVHPSMSMTVNDISNTLENWHRNLEWTPDVIVIDYADNLASTRTRMEYREQINYTWAELRQISQQYHACLITATQSDAKAYGSPLITRKNFSDSKKKLAHVTGMLGINVTDEEKGNQTGRLNWIELRDADFTESEVVHYAGCLSMANPAILSCFVEKSLDA